MTNGALFHRLRDDAEKWRAGGWPCEDAPFIREILRWQFAGDPADKTLKFLRWPQFQALEVYWMLRLKFGTPHIMDLYKEIYADLPVFLKALGVPSVARHFATAGTVVGEIRKNDDFVKENNLDALREAAVLPYPSYIFALTMGAGKTILIGAIIATEFAMALRRPDDARFMRNALVFAPGKTILASLREIAAAPYEEILPPESCRAFKMRAKIIHPSDGDPEIHAEARGDFNIIITNTEKIRLQARPVRRKKNLLKAENGFGRDNLEANSRLQKIKSLPRLGIFSDEAHHTYGEQLGKSIKRVRETVNYIAAHTEVVAVVNTTGTPYHKKFQPLAEVVFWYGIRRGMRENILKGFRVSCRDMRRPENDRANIRGIVREFFREYGAVKLPNGAPAKIAFFFKRIEHLEECREIIAAEMVKIGESDSQILVNTQKSGADAKAEFAALNDPGSRKRVILLVGIGVEGWDCPSLFATALIKGKTSGVFALQASTRCLRQVPGNEHRAKMFLDSANAAVLSREMEKVFFYTLEVIAGTEPVSREVVLRVRKTEEELPKLEIVHKRKRVIRVLPKKLSIKLVRPPAESVREITAGVYVPDMTSRTFALAQVGETTLRERPAVTTPHAAAAQLAANYHLPAAMPLLKQLRKLYPDGAIPLGAMPELAAQVERRTARYKEVDERVVEAMALIRVVDDSGRPLFRRDERGGHFHILRCTESKYIQMRNRKLLVEPQNDAREPAAKKISDAKDLSFHYAPYNFDSAPERAFFESVLRRLNLKPRDIRCFLFTGGLTGAAQTDFFFEYKGVDGRFHRYHPDFVIVRKSGEFLVVEVKGENGKDDKTVEAKARAVRRLEEIQPDKIRYHVVYIAGAAASSRELQPVLKWIDKNEKGKKQKA